MKVAWWVWPAMASATLPIVAEAFQRPASFSFPVARLVSLRDKSRYATSMKRIRPNDDIATSTVKDAEDEPSERTALPFLLNHRPQKPPKPNKDWLKSRTQHYLQDLGMGTLLQDQWPDVISTLHAWFHFAKDDAQAPLQMEALLQRLQDGGATSQIDMDVYNVLLDAWCCAAFFKTQSNINPSQRARELLVSLQEQYEATQDARIKPNADSFDMVLHVVCKTEGAWTARRLLAWMEYLTKSGHNVAAKPTRTDYVIVLDTYANSGLPNSGTLAEGFCRHMSTVGVAPDVLCWNIVIKAYKNSVRGRLGAEHAQRIFDMLSSTSSIVAPDLVTFASVMSAWTASGVKAHAVTQVEKLLERIENDSNLEPNTIVYNTVMSAWVKSRHPGAAERTAELLQQLRRSDSCQPDIFSYNTHLHALSLDSKLEAAPKADALLDEMTRMHETGELGFAPNLFSYNCVIDAHCRSSDSTKSASRQALQVLRKLIRCRHAEPDSYSFNQVLRAVAASREPDAAATAESLLEYMEEAYSKGLLPDAKPDVIGYGVVMTAHARSLREGAADRAQHLLNELRARYAAGENDVKPTRICYNSVIDAWAKSGRGTFAARQAEALLQEMQDMYEAGDEAMKPDIVTFNGVLNAWARSGTRCCGLKAETYLDRMWEMYKVKPNDYTYNTVINAISKSQNAAKAQRALRVLRRMDKHYRAGNKEARPNAVTYTAVLNSCAFPALPDSRTRRKALDTAIFTLEELQASRYGHPNQVTYGTFIKACANLLHDDEERRRQVIERAFRQCCHDGQVGEMVLTYLRRAAPKGLYEELLADIMDLSTSRQVSVEDLPEKWRCNVRSKDGWKKKKPPRNPGRGSHGKPFATLGGPAETTARMVRSGNDRFRP